MRLLIARDISDINCLITLNVPASMLEGCGMEESRILHLLYPFLFLKTMYIIFVSNISLNLLNLNGSKGVVWYLASEGRNIKRSEQTQINLHHQGILRVWEFSTTISMQIDKDSLKMLSQNKFCLIEWNKC